MKSPGPKISGGNNVLGINRRCLVRRSLMIPNAATMGQSSVPAPNPNPGRSGLAIAVGWAAYWAVAVTAASGFFWDFFADFLLADFLDTAFFATVGFD